MNDSFQPGAGRDAASPADDSLEQESTQMSNVGRDSQDVKPRIEEPVAAAAVANRKYLLKIVESGSNNLPLTVKVKSKLKFNKVFNAFANNAGRSVAVFKFFYDGERIVADQTVGEVLNEDYEDGYDEDTEIQIDVMIEQQGGQPKKQ